MKLFFITYFLPFNVTQYDKTQIPLKSRDDKKAMWDNFIRTSSLSKFPSVEKGAYD